MTPLPSHRKSNNISLYDNDWPVPFFLLLQQVKNALKYTVGFAIVCVVLLLIGWVGDADCFFCFTTHQVKGVWICYCVELMRGERLQTATVPFVWCDKPSKKKRHIPRSKNRLVLLYESQNNWVNSLYTKNIWRSKQILFLWYSIVN